MSLSPANDHRRGTAVDPLPAGQHRPADAATRSSADDFDEPLILSFTPAAPGWFVIWGDAAGEVRQHLVGWALVEHRWPGGSCRVVTPMAIDDDGPAAHLADARDGYRRCEYLPGALPGPVVSAVTEVQP